MATFQIYGSLREKDTGRPMSGMYIEIYGSSAPANQQFWMGGGKSDENGYFSIYLREDVSPEIATPSVSAPLTLVVFYGDHVIHTQNITGAYNDIVVPTQHYNFYYYYYYGNEGTPIDPTHERTENLFFLIEGRVTTTSGIAVPGKRVNACVKEFRNAPVICRAYTDENGYYSMKIAYLSLNNPRRMVIKTDFSPVVTSQEIQEFPIRQVVDLEVDPWVLDFSDFFWLYHQISSVVGYIELAGVTTEGDERETLFIANSIGRDEASIRAVVRARWYIVQEGWDVHDSWWYPWEYAPEWNPYAQFVYAILKSGVPDDKNTIFGLLRARLEEIWDDARWNRIMDFEYTWSDFNAIVNDFEDVAIMNSASIEIEGAGISFSDFFGNIFPTGAFSFYNISILNYEGDEDDVTEFWEYFASIHGLNMTSWSQRSFQLASITGYQAEMANEIIVQLDNLYWSDIYHGARLSIGEWETLISNAGGEEDAVPQIIKDHSSTPVQDYAERLKDICQNMYPAIALAHHLDGTYGQNLIPDGSTRTQVIAFLNSNPEFDMRKDSVYDMEEPMTLLVLSFVYDVAVVKEALAPFQVLSRITDARVDAIVSLKLAGIDSANAVTAMAQTEFVNNYSAVLGGSVQAQNAYMVAQKISQIGLQSTVQLSAVVNSPNWVWLAGSPKPDPIANPDLATLFGDLEQCGCSECMSVYSAGAYYVDVLNFIKKYGEHPDSTYIELTRRRPDLLHIDISCKNANTALPYVDLVNERLEVLILEHLNASGIPLSYQTVGNAADLAAYPEHVVRLAPSETYVDYTGYESIYNTTLVNAVFPLKLPFSLQLEEARVYLEHLGYKRLRLMELFRPYNDTTIPVTGITKYNYYTESAGMMKKTADIITKNNGGFVYEYYGFSGTTVSNFISPTDSSVKLSGNWELLLRGALTGSNQGGLDVLLYLLDINYKELLELLATDFLNKPIGGNSPVGVEARAGEPTETCVLRELQLEIDGISSSEFFDKLHRFVRLWSGTGLAIYQLDILLRAFNVTDITNEGSYPLYENLMRAFHLAGKLKVPVERFATWWAVIDTHHYKNYNSDRREALPSVYDRFFRSKNILNPPDPAFDNPSSYIYAGHTGVIMAASGISEEDLIQLMSPDALDIPMASNMSYVDLTRIFSVATICNALKIKVIDFVRFCTLNNIQYGRASATPDIQHAYTQLEELDDLLNRMEMLGGSGFTLSDIRYLLLNKDESAVYMPEEKVIQPFYEGMRDELKKAYVDISLIDPPPSPETEQALQDTLRNVVIQRFATEFGITAETVLFLLRELFTIGYDDTGTANYNTNLPVLDGLISPDFIASVYELSKEGIAHAMPPTTPAPAKWPFINLFELYPLYYRMHKMALLFTKSGVRFSELELLQEHHVILQVPDLRTYPYTSQLLQARDMFEALMRYLRWIRARRQLAITDDNFGQLIVDSVSGTKTEWINTVIDITQWSVGQATELVGSGSIVTAAGLLNVVFPDDFRDPLLLLRMANIVSVSGSIGLAPTQIGAVLTSSLQMSDARKVRMAARSKYDEAAWLKIAKPLQDPLREQQRDALVAYVLSKPVPWVVPPPLSPDPNTKVWRTKNDLYAWLLMDVEMQPCTMTSRIRLALSSLQMFMGRVIMNLETVNGKHAETIQLNPQAIEQWEAWRKWYRIWEANRKVFLYPENWIEPELRDNKTPFFKELETQLQQDELNNDTAVNAYFSYLEKLDGVARLEPVASYHEIERIVGIDVIHVVARTYEEPATYYYRKFTDGEWTAWEKMNIDPKSDHITLIAWNRRLYVFWLSFMEQQFDDAEGAAFIRNLRWDPTYAEKGKMDGYTQFWLRRYGRHDMWGIAEELGQGSMSIEAAKSIIMKGWDIRLNWSEYKDGKWGDNKSATDVMQMYPWAIILTTKAQLNLDDTITTLKDSHGRIKFDVLSNMLRNGKDLSINELFKNRLYLYPQVEQTGGLVLSLMFPAALDEMIIGMHGFIFDAPGSQPRVLRDSDRGYKMRSPHNTVLNKMKFVKTAFSPENWLSVDKYTREPGQNYFIYPTHSFAGNNFADHSRLQTSLILKNTPFGQYKVTAKSNPEPSENVSTNITRNDFFFDDDRHLFFVRRKELSLSLSVANLAKSPTKVSLGTTLLSYKENYADVFAAAGSGSLLDAGGNATPAAMPLPASTLTSATVAFTTTPFVYYFQTFYHSHIQNFIKAVNKDGIDGLLNIRMQVKVDNMSFQQHYTPTTLVYKRPGTYPYPTDIVDFDYDGAYSLYNWELFYHIPMIVAQRLSDNQQFETAQKWYHYIFNPTSNTNDQGQISGSKQRFWKCRPFYEEAGKQILTLRDMMNEINKYGEQVTLWEKKPFSPHVIARMRILAYMKNTVMKYLDNLIAWGDQLFRRDTVESLNEATQLYILASNILGRRPPEVPARGVSNVYNFDELDGQGLDRFSNAKVKIESLIDNNVFPPGQGNGEAPKMLYFCLPQNDKLMGYWDVVADRLFKIRNCMNIEGVVRQLPLFDPPIDPGMLVRAAAAGIDINSVLDDIAGIGMPHYRFNYVLQRANEICGDIKALGGALLSALEKKDAEALALIRAGHETKVLESVKAVRESQIADAEQALEILKKTREVTEVRLQYYASRPYMIGEEHKHLEAIKAATILQAIQAGLSGTSAILSIIPNVHVQAVASGVSIGGSNFANAMNAASTALGIAAMINNAKGTMAVTMAGYKRRRDDWQFQAASAAKELEQIDQQIAGAEIRLEITQKELASVELQIENSMDTDSYMRSKYTNEQLYSWMISQISTVYFQSYQLAFDVAKKAEMCLDREIPFASDKKPKQGFIKFGYWDSLKKGLLSGEKMQYDLRKMEVFHMEENKRELELTKHVSLAFLNPEKLMVLKSSGSCSGLWLTEELFDLDYPGHYMRRIKSVSISIPCVAGPYTTINCQLSQTRSKYRKNTLDPENYPEDTDTDNRFVYLAVGNTIATSSAQNDSGVFELNFNDQRYLPFEGTGAISEWTLAMPAAHPLFDRNTIQDVIIHVKYTAQLGTPALVTAASQNLDDLFDSVDNFPRLFSLRHEFPDAWTAAFEEETPVPGPPAGLARPLVIPMNRTLYPEYAQRKQIDLTRLDFILRPAFQISPDVRFYLRINGTGDHLELAPTAYENGKSVSITLPEDMEPQDLNLAFYKKVQDTPVEYIPVDPEDVDDLFMITSYTLSPL